MVVGTYPMSYVNSCVNYGIYGQNGSQIFYSGARRAPRSRPVPRYSCTLQQLTHDTSQVTSSTHATAHLACGHAMYSLYWSSHANKKSKQITSPSLAGAREPTVDRDSARGTKRVECDGYGSGARAAVRASHVLSMTVRVGVSMSMKVRRATSHGMWAAGAGLAGRVVGGCAWRWAIHRSQRASSSLRRRR